MFSQAEPLKFASGFLSCISWQALTTAATARSLACFAAQGIELRRSGAIKVFKVSCFWILIYLPFLQQTWYLWEGTWKISFLLKEPPVRCHVSGREGIYLFIYLFTYLFIHLFMIYVCLFVSFLLCCFIVLLLCLFVCLFHIYLLFV